MNGRVLAAWAVLAALAYMFIDRSMIAIYDLTATGYVLDADAVDTVFGWGIAGWFVGAVISYKWLKNDEAPQVVQAPPVFDAPIKHEDPPAEKPR